MKLLERIMKVLKEPNVFEDYDIKYELLKEQFESEKINVGVLESKSKKLTDKLENLNYDMIERHDEFEENLRFTKILKNKYKDLKGEYKEMELHFDETCDKLRELFKLQLKDIDMTTFYNKYIAYDTDGWCKYYAAKALIPIEVTSFFYAEDNKGYFENSNGFELINWLEIAKFGDIQYEQINSYEIVDSYKLDNKTEMYHNYQKELIKKSSEKLIEQLLERDIEELYEVFLDISNAEPLRMIS